MKKLAYPIVFIFMLLSALCNAQEPKSANILIDLQVEAGADTVFCETEGSSEVHIGDRASVNGEQPLAIAWETSYTVGSTTYTASDFLSDTTVLNPTFNNKPLGNEEVKFYLNVSDAQNNTKRDSITVIFSQFAFLLGYEVYNIAPGDSIQLSYTGTVGGGIEPLQYYLWNPYEGFTDSTANGETPKSYWCKPVVDTDYQGWVVDGAGCVSPKNTMFKVLLLESGVENTDVITKRISVKGDFIHSNLSKTLTYEFFNLNGKSIAKTTSASEYVRLPDFKNEIIILRVTGEGFSETLKLNF